MSDPRRKFRWLLYLIALAALAAGYTSAGMISWRAMKTGSGLELMRAPGEKSFRLPAGHYTLYHEFEGVVDDKMYYQDLVPKYLAYSVLDGATGTTLTLTPESPRPQYRLGSRRGANLAGFDLPTSATVQLRVAPTGAAKPDPTVFAIGNGHERATMSWIHRVRWIVLGASGLAAALWLIAQIWLTPDRRR